jgi:hypothetical protein
VDQDFINAEEPKKVNFEQAKRGYPLQKRKSGFSNTATMRFERRRYLTVIFSVEVPFAAREALEMLEKLKKP